MKSLSIFDLQEGKIYDAFDGSRRLDKRYTVQNGQLKNANKDEDPNELSVYENCDWVPLKASINFKEVFQAHKPVRPVDLAIVQLTTMFTAIADAPASEVFSRLIPKKTRKIAKSLVTSKSKSKSSARATARR